MKWKQRASEPYRDSCMICWCIIYVYVCLLLVSILSNLTLVPCSRDTFPAFLILCGILDGILSRWDFMVNFVGVIQWVNSLKLRLRRRSQHFNNRMRCWINTSTHKLNLISTISNSLFHSTNLHNPFHPRQLHSNQHHKHQCHRHQIHRHLQPLQPINLGLPRPSILMRCSNRWSPQWNPVFKQWWKRLKNVKSTLLHHSLPDATSSHPTSHHPSILQHPPPRQRSSRRSRSHRHGSPIRRPDKRPVSIRRSPRRRRSSRRPRRSSRNRSCSRSPSRHRHESPRKDRERSITLRSASPPLRGDRQPVEEYYQPHDYSSNTPTLQASSWWKSQHSTGYTNPTDDSYQPEQSSSNKWQSWGKWKNYSKNPSSMHQSTWDDPKKPSNRHTTSNPRHHESWNYTPLLRHTRRVLVIIDLEQVQHLMSARQSDVRQAPTCDALPSLGRLEQYALFTYSFLVTPAQTQILTVDTILYYISQHLNNTWGFYLEPSSMDLRWSDCLTVQEIPLRFAIINSSLICYVNTVLIGLKAKNSESLIRSETSTTQVNRTLCAWVAIRHFLTLTCCHDSLPGKSARLAVCIFSFQCRFLLISCFSFMSFCLFCLNLAYVWIMTKRDSSFADLESPRNLMSFPRRHPAQHGSGAASSNGASSSSNAMLSWAYQTVPPQRSDETGTTVEAHQFGYTALAPSVPLPPVNPPGPPMEAYKIRYNWSCHRTIGCSTLTSSKRSFRLPSQAKAVVWWWRR